LQIQPPDRDADNRRDEYDPGPRVPSRVLEYPAGEERGKRKLRQPQRRGAGRRRKGEEGAGREDDRNVAPWPRHDVRIPLERLSQTPMRLTGLSERAIASEPRERSAPAKRGARDRVG